WRFTAATTCALAASALIFWLLGAAGRLGVEPEVPLMVAIGLLITNTNLLVSIRCTLRGTYRLLAVAGAANAVAAAATSIGIALGIRADAWALFLGTSFGTLVGVAVARGVPRQVLMRRSGLSRAEKQRILAFGAPTALTSLMYWVLGASDRWFIALLSNQHELGVYSFAYNVGNLATLLNTAVSQAWLPEVFRSFDRDPNAARDAMADAWSRTFLVLAVAWLGVSASGGDVIRLLAAPAFHPGAEYVPWIAGGIFFYGLYLPASSGLMLRNGLRAAAGWWLAGAGLTLALNYLLIRSMGAYGAAVSATLGFALISGGVLWSSQRRLHMPLPWAKMLAVGSILLIAGLLTGRPWHPSPLVSLAWKLLPCAAACGLAFRIAWPSAWGAAWLRLRELVAPGRDRRH
ncbi:MAG: lipopolysaccharide biosynthesis protein, partial [Myxococcota bacterium]